MKILTVSLLMLTCAIYGCATSLKTSQRGNVNASMDKAVQDTKDALNTYGFDIQNVETSNGEARLSGKRGTGQEAWVEIDPAAGSSSTVAVKVNQEGPDEIGADVIFDDIKARSQK